MTLYLNSQRISVRGKIRIAYCLATGDFFPKIWPQLTIGQYLMQPHSAESRTIKKEISFIFIKSDKNFFSCGLLKFVSFKITTQNVLHHKIKPVSYWSVVFVEVWLRQSSKNFKRPQLFNLNIKFGVKRSFSVFWETVAEV